MKGSKEVLPLDYAPVLVRASDGRVKYWSRGAGEMYGWCAEEAEGKIAHELLVTAFPEPLLAIGRALLRDGFWKGELRQRRKDGSAVISSSHWIVQRHGNVVEVNADITEIRQAEAARLAQASEEFNSLVISICQGLAIPLPAIHSLAAALIEDNEDYFDELSRDEARQLIARVANMERLIGDLSAYSGISAARLEAGHVNLDTITDAVVLQFRSSISAKGASVVIRRPLGKAIADPAILAPVLSNLLANALNFTRPDTPPEVTIGTTPDAAKLRLWVEDHGVGVPSESRERIFQLFQLAETPTIIRARAPASPSLEEAWKG